MPPISTVRSTGMRATGTSSSTPAIRAATISTSVALTSTYLTVEVIAGALTETEAGITEKDLAALTQEDILE